MSVQTKNPLDRRDRSDFFTIEKQIDQFQSDMNEKGFNIVQDLNINQGTIVTNPNVRGFDSLKHDNPVFNELIRDYKDNPYNGIEFTAQAKREVRKEDAMGLVKKGMPMFRSDFQSHNFIQIFKDDDASFQKEQKLLTAEGGTDQLLEESIKVQKEILDVVKGGSNQFRRNPLRSELLK